VLLYTNGSDRSFIGMRTSEILFNHTCAVHGLFPTCTCYVSQLEKWSVIDFYWFAATGFGINPFLLSEKAVVISAFQGCFFLGESSFSGLLPLLAAGVFYIRSNFGPRHGPA